VVLTFRERPAIIADSITAIDGTELVKKSRDCSVCRLQSAPHPGSSGAGSCAITLDAILPCQKST